MKVQFPVHTLLAIAALATTVFACNTETLVVGSRYVKSLRVDPIHGATLAVSAEDSPELAGTVLVIPPGALASERTITVELGFEDLVAGADRPAGPVAAFGPAGLTFSSPARLTLPLRDDVRSPHALFVEVREANGERFRISGADLEVTSDRVTFDVNGFTSFQPGSEPVQCASDSDCAQGETCVNGDCTSHEAGTPCHVDGDCAGGEICHQGACVVNTSTEGGRCETVMDCGVDEGCNHPYSKQCLPQNAPACQTSDECDTGFFGNGHCWAGTCARGACNPLVPFGSDTVPRCELGPYCFVRHTENTTWTTCAGATAARSEGQTCTEPTDCITGVGTANAKTLWCSGLVPNVSSTGICRAFCDTTIGAASCLQFPVAKQCLPIPGAGPGLGYCAPVCSQNSDCSASELCAQNVCVPCPGGTCTAAGGTPPCKSHSDCLSGKVCLNNGICATSPSGCAGTAYCPLGTTCIQGNCT